MNSKKSIKSKIISYLDGELEQDELRKLLQWIGSSEENTRYYARVKDLWESSIGRYSEFAETEKEWERFQQTIKEDRAQKVYFRTVDWRVVLRMAAVLVVGILLGSVLLQGPLKSGGALITTSAPMGSISKTLLNDSTVVFLNAGSEIRYTVGGGKVREVFLQGEAWFKVKHMDHKPFIVHTDYYDVKVLGTEFNVKAYETESEVTTTLEKGAVLISGNKRHEIEKEITLKPGQQLVLNRESTSFKIKKVNTSLYTSWKDRKLEFIKMRLDELIVLLERKYGIEIEVVDKEILNYHYSGTIKDETIFEILEIIEQTLPVHYEIKNQKIKIYKQ
ncbi:FecR domain-containing protein [uncultured Sunxiuqinia sp.]|uniref:FecR family protein n=1 Tax=uncultured Sunxiuqinia sp. TaxID=1573825 RepID=UPI002AA60577|nr:FecR domain-containing protein [uncultured Sunxiuqinia sp.]